MPSALQSAAYLVKIASRLYRSKIINAITLAVLMLILNYML